MSEAVRRSASTRLSEFLAHNPASGGERVLVRLEVVTGAPLADAAKAEITASLEEVRAGYGDTALRLLFSVDPSLGDGHDVRPVLLTRARDGASTGGHADAVDEEPRLLVLSFGGLRFEYLLDPRPRWAPLGRPDGRDTGVGLVIPQSMAAVPHGRLLEVWFTGGTMRVRRTEVRPEYAVSVNGVTLAPQVTDGLPVASVGTIGYRAGDGPHLTLEYELADWATGRPSAGGPCDPLDDAPHTARLLVDGRSGPLWIKPPARASRAQSRRFPIPASAPDHPVRDLHAQVHYTEATGGPERDGVWHVKIYRCATPQHAAQLRRYLRTQAALVEQVNAQVGGSGQSPPWAIAPVHVLAADSGYAGQRRDTGVVSAAEVAGDPENRLSAWFGVTDQPQPGCFVIVASPMLSHVGWADSTLRVRAPGVEQLPALRALATGLDQCHQREIAHCDIKPENVCRYVRANGDSGYVLIDGDAVTRTTGKLADLRFTAAYASPEVIARARRVRAPARDDFDLREHDRFGFVLVVLTAIIGADRVSGLLTEDDDGRRGVDSPRVVENALRGRWDPEWDPFLAELAAPFQPDALVGDDWTAEGWLDRLTALKDPDPADEDGGGEPDEPPRGRFGDHVAAVRAEVRSTPHNRTRYRPAVVEAIKRHQLAVARAEYWRVVGFYGLVPVLVSLLVLIAVVVRP